VDRKLDLLVGELKRYGISVAGVQETKWFGSDIWPAVDGHIMLHSGRSVPQDGATVVRREGVGIVLNPKAAAAWKAAGEVWKAVSSRLIMARLKWVRKKWQQLETSYVTVLCAYAPTAKAPPSVKTSFFEQLQDCLDSVPRDDTLLILGDFNAHVGVFDDNETWTGVLGKHGIGVRNSAGEDLLQFCGINQLSVMNSFFEKRYYGTWIHPGTRISHMIDFVLMKTSQRISCMDVQVMRGATCWTDHYMVRCRVRVSLSCSTSKQKRPLPFAIHKFSRPDFVNQYVTSLEERLCDGRFSFVTCAEDNWKELQSCIVASAEDSIGRGFRSNPEWFEDSYSELKPLIDKKNDAYRKFLQVGTRSRRSAFKRLQQIVRKAVVKAKEDWVNKVATEGEAARRDGQARWGSIRRLQRAHSGRRPVKTAAVLKTNGELTKGPEEVTERWYEHFKKLLNIQSIYDEDVIAAVPTLPPLLGYDDPPTSEELEDALSQLKTRRAGGLSGIVPELVLFGGPVLQDRLLALMRRVWDEGRVVEAWRDALIVPVPKKGNLQSCDNWRGISLLDVVGKIFGRIVQNRLQAIAEGLLPDSQCGFRKGRGCTDMIFVARQLMEKTREHGDSLFLLFVDLKKAYDSVPRDALWTILEKCGVPTRMLGIIRSFHEGMYAGVRVGSTVSDRFEVRNGLRQGCTMAPTLFNIYFNAMVASWRDRSVGAGVTVLFKHGRRLVGDRTAKSRLERVKVTESQFADDLALYAASRAVFESAGKGFVLEAGRFGLTVSLPKTKGMAVGAGSGGVDVSPLSVEDGLGEIEMVSEFTYLGSCLCDDGEVTNEVACRIAKASKAFGSLREAIFMNRTFSVSTKRNVYKAVVLSVLLYGAETWTIKAPDLRRLTTFHNRCVRSILGVSRYQQWRERITTKNLSEAFGMQWSVSDFIMERRLRWLGHLGRMSNDRLPKQLLFGELQRKRPFHGTKKRWRDGMLSDLKAISIEDSWYSLCQDRLQWTTLCNTKVWEVAHSRKLNICAANLSHQDMTFNCSCGRQFHRQGDLTRHRRFCKDCESRLSLVRT